MRAVCVAAGVVGFVGVSAQGALVEFTFGGTITDLPVNPAQFPAPSPFAPIMVGASWTMRYVFESGTVSVAGTPAGTRAFPNALRSASLTVGGSTSSLPLPPANPPAFGSLFQRGIASEDVYEVQIPFGAGSSPLAGIILNDPMATAVPDPFVLLTTLNLNAFSSRVFYIQPPLAGFENTFRGTVTSFLPAPGSGAMMLIAGLALRRRR